MKPKNANLPLLKIVFLCFFFMLARTVFAQTEPVDSEFTQQLWFDFDPSWDVGGGEKIIGNFGYRTVHPKSWHRVIFKAAYQKSFDQFIFKRFKHTESFRFGSAFFILTNKEEGSYGAFEIRPYQGYKLGFHLSPRIIFEQYLRMEERFVFSKDPNNQVFGLRFRYQVEAIINLEGLWFEEQEGFYLPIAIEGFFNLVSASQFNDVIRVTPGLGYQFKPDFKIEASLAYHYTKEEVDKLSRTNDIVFRFRIIKQFN